MLDKVFLLKNLSFPAILLVPGKAWGLGWRIRPSIRVVPLAELSQTFNGSRVLDGFVETLGLDPEALIQGHAEAAYSRLFVGAHGALGE